MARRCTCRASAPRWAGARAAKKSSASAFLVATTSSNPGPKVSSDGSVRHRRSRSVAVSPAPTTSRYQAAALVPIAAGLTVDAQSTRWSLMPSLGYGVRLGVPHSRWWLLSFSQNTSSGSPSAASQNLPRAPWSATTTPGAGPADSRGRRSSRPHAQVLRNHSVGSTCSGAGSGPRLAQSTTMHMSSGSALA